MKSMLEELKDVKIKKHTVTSIEYDCKSEEKEDEVFDQVHNIVTNHLDDNPDKLYLYLLVEKIFMNGHK